MKVSGLHLEVCGERLPVMELVAILAECIGNFGDSFYIIIAYFFHGNGNDFKVEFSSSLWGKVPTFSTYIMTVLLFLAPFAESVMWI